MAKSLLRSFAGGEITPEMFGRLDLPKFQTGLQKARNVIILPAGPADSRPGFYFRGECLDSTHAVRLIPFVFSATQSVAIEFGHQYVRFHTETGTVLETAVPITSVTNANPGVFTRVAHGYTNGDWLFVSAMAGMTSLNGRFLKVAAATANTYQLQDLNGVAIDTSALPAYTGSGQTQRVYTLASPYSETDLPLLDFAQDSDVLTITTSTLATRELRRSGATSWAFSVVSFAPTVSAPTGVGAVATIPTATNPTTQRYVVTAVLSDLVTESVASSEATCSNNLAIAGNFNTISWGAVGGAARYYVYRYRGGSFGYIGQSTTTSLVDDNILPDTTTTPPESTSTLNSGVGEYPSAVTHFERRRWFAGTTLKPQTIWATRNGTLSNLTSSIPARADDGMEFRIASVQQNAIRHLMPLNDLVALTVGGEFRIYADPGPAIAPDTLALKPQGSSGASPVQPVLAKSAVMYVQAQGSRVNELTYDPSGTGALKSTDVSILATHLFDGYEIVDLAFQRTPEPVLWVVRDDGVLMGMTYLPDQQVFAWHQHDTDGFFESVAVVPESNRDVLYAVVRRTVGGVAKRYVERLSPRFFATQADAFLVDSGLTYTGAPSATVTGLWHLEGKIVVALADGAVVDGLTVGSGAVALPFAASKVHVGLPYSSDWQTLPSAYEAAPAGGQGTAKNVTGIFVRVRKSAIIKAGPDFDHLTENRAHPIGVPIPSVIALQDGELDLRLTPKWQQDGSVCIRRDKPLPLTLVSIALDTAVGG